MAVRHRNAPCPSTRKKLFGTDKLNLPRSDIPTSTHVDYSTCIQTAHPDTNPRFAAESHVDRSITGPEAFIKTNVHGSFTLLEAARKSWQSDTPACRFMHVSTDEVYGSLGPDAPAFTETTAFAPNSPYSASKAASDHLVRAWMNCGRVKSPKVN